MSNSGTQVQTVLRVRLATAAALPTCTYADASTVLPTSTLGAKLTASVAGALTVDGIAAAVDDEILVKDQVATLQNGVYRVRSAGSTTATWSLTRSRDAMLSEQFKGMVVTVGPSGSANKSGVFVYSGGDTPTVGTDAITFAGLSSSTTVNSMLPDNPGFGDVASGDNVITVPTGLVTVAVNSQTATLATLTIRLGDGAFKGQIIFWSNAGIVTALTCSGANFNTEGLAQPTAWVAKQCFGWVWDDGTDGGTVGWERFQ